jgi:hypothetical protein
VSSDASTSIVASHQTTEAADHPDSANVTAALDALYMDFYENKLDPISVTPDAPLPLCAAREGLLKKATENIPACDRVSRMNDFTELKPLNAAIDAIVLLTRRHDESRVEISKIGGVEDIMNVMESFPNWLA